MTNARPLLLLIDGHALAFRAFHALADTGMRASTGEPTYAVYGFATILLSAVEEHHPTYLAVSFDVGRTFRDDLYAEYKAGRGETPTEFHPQLDRIKQLVTSLNIPIYTAEGYEADDVIGTLARQASAQGAASMILTGDTDTLQLVDDHVCVLLANPYGKKTTTTIYDEQKVLERYKGLRPSQLADLRGLKGDTSDNIPGIKGIGEAGAIALLNQFGTVENLYDHLDQAPKRYQKVLAGQREQALFSKKLATIVCDAPVALNLKDATLSDYDRARVIDLFHELEFGATLVRRLPTTHAGLDTVDLPETTVEPAADPLTPAPEGDSEANTASGPQQLAMFDLPASPAGHSATLIPPPTAARSTLGDYRAVQTEEALAEVLAALSAAPAFAFDTEINGLRPMQDELVGISLAVQPGRAWYIPFGHQAGEQLPRSTILDALRPFFADPARPKYAHNAKFDIEALEHAGLEVNGVTFDTMLAAALLDKRKGLKDLAFYELKLPEPMTPIEELIGRGKHQIVFGATPIDVASQYAAADADMTLRLVEALRPQLEALPRVNDIFHKLEMPLLPVIVRMEQAGIGVDEAFMRGLGKRLGQRLVELEREIYAYNQGPFNIGSSAQLADVLFGKLGLATTGVDKTKTGQYSLTAMTLEALRDAHPDDPNYQIIDLILQHRQLTKLKSTYVDALPELINPQTGRIHTSFSQIGAATGRLSCLPAGTLVNTQRGLVGIETVRPGDFVRTPYGARRIRAWEATGEKQVVSLKLSNGITIQCSPEHRIRSKGSWIEAQNIAVGDPVYMSFTPGMFGDQTSLQLHYTSHYDTCKTPMLPTEWTVELAELIGYHMADGHTASCPSLEVSGVDIAGAIEQLGAGGKSQEIRVPPGMFLAPEPIVAAFLRGYFEGDGYAGLDGGINAKSVSRAMLEDVQQLLTLFGIPSTIRVCTPDPRGYATRYMVAIVGDRSKQVFSNRIGFLSKRKQAACAAVVAQPKIKSAAEVFSLPEHFDINSLKPAGIANSSAIFLHEAVSAQYYEVHVVEIEHKPAVPMYDIAVDHVAQYMAQGIVVHNSSDPNLQNIPTRTDEGREIRRGFEAAKGCVFVAADYSQIELRVLAHVTQDHNLVQAFMEDQDIHAATASQLFHVPITHVDKNQRRVAKCVAAGTLVSTDQGIIPIEKLGSVPAGDVVALHCAVAQEGERCEKATGFYNGGVQPTIRITTRRGYVLEATAQHRVRSLDADGNYVWRTLGELVQGEYVALARGAMLFGHDQTFNVEYKRRKDNKLQLPVKLTPTFARFLGYFVSEGNFVYHRSSSSVVIANADQEVLRDLRHISLEVFGMLPKEVVGKNGVTSLRWHCSRLVELLEYLNVGILAANKRIPEAIMQGSYESVAAFLSSYFEGDGSISRSFISASSKSSLLIQQLQTLLLNLGIVCYLEHRDIPVHGRHYKLRIIGKDSRVAFAQHIGFVSKRKNAPLWKLIARRQTNEPIMLPLQRERLARMYPRTKLDLKETIHTCIRTKSPTVALTYRRLTTILEQFPEPEDVDFRELKAHQERNLFYDRVAQIEHAQSQVYDLVVPSTHTYIANGFVSHNTVIFGVIYGISSFGLAPRIGSSRTEAQALINELFARFPGIRDYIDGTLELGRREGYVHSLFGRRRPVPELRQSGPRRQAAEREAINAPIQATAADIMKIAMIRVDEELRRRGLKTRMLLQVHDELILEAPEDELQEVIGLVRERMESAYELHVPLKVDVESGPNWLQMKDAPSS